MTGWRIRWLGGHRQPEVEHEAAIDFRDAQIEGLRDRIRELERDNAVLRQRLAVALLPQWMPQTIRQRHGAANLDRTQEIRYRGVSCAPTEMAPRRHR